jgi:hypothetical protein
VGDGGAFPVPTQEMGAETQNGGSMSVVSSSPEMGESVSPEVRNCTGSDKRGEAILLTCKPLWQNAVIFEFCY